MLSIPLSLRRVGRRAGSSRRLLSLPKGKHRGNRLAKDSLRTIRPALNTCVDCRVTACTANGTPRRTGKEELAATLSNLKLTREIACPCVWQGHIRDQRVVASVHGDDITIGGKRPTVESLIKMISRKYEIKKQVIGRKAAGY